MPRKPRLDIEGALHHVIARGINRDVIFKNNRDRGDFVERLGRLVRETGTGIYAWALLPNHFHLLIRSGPDGLPSLMRRLLTGYAISFNKRHNRSGHLFQNRYKSIICEEEPYFRELVRYIHLNPLRSHIVRSLKELDEFTWSGHHAILGKNDISWQDISSVLLFFGHDLHSARQAYRNFLANGIADERCPQFSGFGQRKFPRDNDLRPDERILGSREFTVRMINESKEDNQYLSLIDKHRRMKSIIEERCKNEGIPVEALTGGSKAGNIPKIRSDLAYRLVQELGISYTEIGRRLGICVSRVSKILANKRKVT